MAAEVPMNGVDDLVRKLRDMAPAMRKRVLRNALTAGARLVRDEAKRNAPVLGPLAATPYRKSGTLRDAIRVRTSKAARRAGDTGVFVNVVPAKGAKFKTVTTNRLFLKVKTRVKKRDSQRGAKSPNDPFYWRFLEFGTQKMAARSFLRPAVGKLEAALAVFQAQVGRWIEKVNASGKVIP